MVSSKIRRYVYYLSPFSSKLYNFGNNSMLLCHRPRQSHVWSLLSCLKITPLILTKHPPKYDNTQCSPPVTPNPPIHQHNCAFNDCWNLGFTPKCRLHKRTNTKSKPHLRLQIINATEWCDARPGGERIGWDTGTVFSFCCFCPDLVLRTRRYVDIYDWWTSASLTHNYPARFWSLTIKNINCCLTVSKSRWRKK